MRNRLVPSNNSTINSAVINYFEIAKGNHNFADPDIKVLKFMGKSIRQKLKEKYPLAKKPAIDDFLYVLFREVVVGDTNELYPRIPPRERRPLLSALFAKSRCMEQVCEEIKNYWFYSGTYSKNGTLGMTLATVVMLEKACFDEEKLIIDNMDEECAELMKQIIPPNQWISLARYAAEQMNFSLCMLIRNHFELPEKEQDRLDAVLVLGKLVEMG